MGVPLLAYTDFGTTAVDKINAGIQEANSASAGVGSSATSADLADETAARILADQTNHQFTVDGVADEQARAETAEAAITASVAEKANQTDLVAETEARAAADQTNHQFTVDGVADEQARALLGERPGRQKTAGVATRPRTVWGNQRLTQDASAGVLLAATGPFLGWAVEFSPSRVVESLADISFYVPGLLTTSIVNFELKVWSRGAAYGNLLPEQSGDVLVSTTTIAKTAAAEDCTDDNPRRVTIPIDVHSGANDVSYGPFTPDKGYIFILRGKDSSGNYVPIGMTLGQPAGTAPGTDNGDQRFHGWGFGGAGWYVNGGSGDTVSGGDALAFELREYVRSPLDSSDFISSNRQVSFASGTPYPWIYEPPIAANNSWVAPEIILEQGSQSIAIAATPHAHAATTPVTGISDSVQLVYNVNTPLSYQYLDVSTLVLKTVGGATLVNGTDYSIDLDNGNIKGLRNVAQQTVTATYTGWPSRYDLVFIDRLSGQQGASITGQRGGDISEFTPGLPAYKTALWKVLVTYNRGISVIPVYQFHDQERVGQEGRYAAWKETCRKRLPKAMRAARSSGTVYLAEYGDSDQAAGSSNDVTAPNGVNRDNVNFYQSTARLGSDVIAAVPLYDHGDGGGAVHIHTDPIWFLWNEFKARFPGTFPLPLNWSIGGTSSDTGNPLDGLDPRRLNHLLTDITAKVNAGAAYVVLLGFGGNELGSLNIYPNLVSIIQQIQAAGAEVIVEAMPLYPESAHRATADKWLWTCARKMDAAEDTGSAYAPYHWLADPYNLGGLGLARRTLCTTSGIGHCGPNEYANYGRFLAKIVP